jgi:dienelactone hydrolase
MLIQESYKDVTTQDGGSMRIFTFHPQIPNYPKAKFPGVVVFSEIYQGKQALGCGLEMCATVSRMRMVLVVETFSNILSSHL